MQNYVEFWSQVFGVLVGLYWVVCIAQDVLG